MSDLTITAEDRRLEADWLVENPALRNALESTLPVEGRAARWGDELYFGATLSGNPESTSEDVPVGTLAYWTSGEALALFWGPTPASTDETPRAASPVAPLARVEDVSPLDAIEGGATVRVEAGED
ncbi:MAG: cyclophilin-like family protein [archaeon]